MTLDELARACVEYRVKHGLTQVQMAKLCGVSAPTIVSLEAGKRTQKTTRARVQLTMRGESNEE